MSSWTYNKDDWQNTPIKKTWDNKSDAIPDWFKKTTVSSNLGTWVYDATNSKNPTLTDEQIIESILGYEGFKEKGFLQDIVAWLRRDAPKKLREALLQMYPLRNLTYKHLCEVVYKMGFRASEIIERRMILGETNEWVREYFKDFPVGK